MPSRRHSSAMVSSPRRPSRTIRIFSSEENLRRVLRLISRTTFSGSLRSAMVHSFCRYRLSEVSIDIRLENVSLRLNGNTRRRLSLRNLVSPPFCLTTKDQTKASTTTAMRMSTITWRDWSMGCLELCCFSKRKLKNWLWESLAFRGKAAN